MKINKLIALLGLCSAMNAYSVETIDFGRVNAGDMSGKPHIFKADRPISIEKLRTTRLIQGYISAAASPLENVQIVITPVQNTHFTGAAFAFVRDDMGNRFTVPAAVSAQAHYAEEYDAVSYDKYGDDFVQALRGYLNGVHKVYSYNEARDIMYGYVDNYNGIVECPYTGRTIAATKRPDGTADFDTEHTWPQSFGARNAPEQSDMHHMRPSYKLANSSRGNLEFGEVVTSVPASQGGFADGGSEKGRDASGNFVFEVRDNFKGDIARGLFYFALKYTNKVNEDGTTGAFLKQTQYDVLKNWHINDAPSIKEQERNSRIKERQFSHNPFIEHPQLIERVNLIGEYSRSQYSMAADSAIVFTTATAIPAYFYFDLQTKLEYAEVIGDNNFTVNVADSNAAASSVYSISINHPVSETAHEAELKVKFVDSPEYRIILRGEATSGVDCIKDCSDAIVYPNPAGDYAIVRISSAGDEDNYFGIAPKVSFSDASGRAIELKYETGYSANSMELRVDLNNQSAGQIFFNVELNGEVHSGIINRKK